MVSDQQAEQLHDWYQSELVRLGFTPAQRRQLIVMLDEGELDLAEFRALLEERGWSPLQAYVWAA